MNNGKKSSKAKTVNTEKCVEEFQVTDRFKKMMVKALKAVMIILKKRAEMLKVENWGDNEKQEFLEIFGIKYDTVITIDSEEEKKKVKKEDPETHRDPYIEKRENITAYQFMKEGVDRMIVICEHLKVKDPVNGNERIHGNFVNLTDDDQATANVPADQTLSLSLDLYETTLKINIFQHFVCKPLTGVESQVSSLCHELSHYYRSGENGKYGGMGTDDMPTKGGFSRGKII